MKSSSVLSEVTRSFALTIPIVTVWPTPKQISNSQNDITNFDLVAVGQCLRWQVVSWHPKQSDIGLRVGTYDFRGKTSAVVEGNLNFFCVFYDVVVGKNVAVVRNDHA